MTALLIPGQALRPLQIAGTPVEEATVGEGYAGFTVTASGGVGQVLFSVIESGGQLPDWTSLDPVSGVVPPGTPEEAGEFDGIIIRATDQRGRTADLAPFDLTVSAASEVPAWVQALAAPSDDLPTDSCVFTASHYYSNSAEQPVTDLFDDVLLDPTKITASGMAVFYGNGNIPKLAGDLLASVATMTGTYRIRVNQTAFPAAGDPEHGEPTPVGGLLLCSVDGNGSQGLDTSIYGLGEGAIGFECTNEEFGNFDQVGEGALNSAFTIAFTLKPNGDTVSSIDGASTFTDVASGDTPVWTPIPPTGQILLGVKYEGSDLEAYFQQIEGYILEFTRWPAQPDADLPTLST